MLDSFFNGENILPYGKHYFKYLTDLIVVKNEIKNACLLTYDETYYNTKAEDEINELKRFAKKNNLNIRFSRLNDNTSEKLKSENEIKIELYKVEFDFGAWAGQRYTVEANKNIFGYPSCCVQKLINYRHRFNYMTTRFDELCETTKKKSLPFYVNPFLLQSPYHIYSHRPCSLECTETLKQSIRNFNVIAKENIHFAKKIRYLNKKIFLFLYDHNYCLIFDGKVKNNHIIYKRIVMDNLPERLSFLREDCKKGDNIITKDDSFIIRKGKEIVKMMKNQKNRVFEFY
ncbi:MAG: hypothetical protein ACLFNK_04985 [Candidatus Woesearchaeota archaeon]